MQNLTQKEIKIIDIINKQEDKNTCKAAIYTPYDIAYYMTKLTLDKYDIDKDFKILEPSAGGGMFILAILNYMKNERGISFKDALENNITIIEKNKDTYKFLKNIITTNNKVNKEDLKIYNYDSLKYFTKTSNKYDVVIGNPPYINNKDLEDNYLDKINNKYETTEGYYNTYISFVEGALKVLKDKGMVNYIIPNNFIKSKDYKNFRDLIFNYNPKTIIDFANVDVFDKTFTRAAILEIENNKFMDDLLFAEAKERDLNSIDLSYIDMSSYNTKDSILNLTEIEKNFIRKMEAGALKLSKLMTSGVATLADNIYKVMKDESSGLYIKEVDGKKYYIEEGILKKSYSIGKDEYSSIIYPYEYKDNKAIPISEEELKNKYPETYSYLLSNKDKLLKRNGGKVKKDEWYLYGKRQGLYYHKKEDTILIPRSTVNFNFKKAEYDDVVYTNGTVINCQGLNRDIIFNSITSNNFKKYVKLLSSSMKGKSYKLNKKMIGKYSYFIDS